MSNYHKSKRPELQTSRQNIRSCDGLQEGAAPSLTQDPHALLETSKDTDPASRSNNKAALPTKRPRVLPHHPPMLQLPKAQTPFTLFPNTALQSQNFPHGPDDVKMAPNQTGQTFRANIISNPVPQCLQLGQHQRTKRSGGAVQTLFTAMPDTVASM